MKGEKYILKNISEGVLMIGVDMNTPGGMASVAKSYAEFFDELNYISSWKIGSKFLKLQTAIFGFINVLFQLIVNGKLKIIHLHVAADASFKRKSIFVSLGKLFNKKIILHMHAADFVEYYEQRADKVWVNKIINKCDKLIVLSNSWREYFLTIGIDNDKIYVLNNIIPFPKIKNKRLKSDRLNLLFLGEIGKRKGVYDLLDVLYDDINYYSDKIFLRIGGNLEEEKIQNYIHKKKLSDFVSFEGWIKGNEKVDILNWEDIFILPSYNEGLPISILESMSYGRPIISTNVGGIPEVVIDKLNGLLVTPGEKKEIDLALKYFINNPDKVKEFGDKSLEIVQSYYPTNVFKSLNTIYLNLLETDKIGV